MILQISRRTNSSQTANMLKILSTSVSPRTWLPDQMPVTCFRTHGWQSSRESRFISQNVLHLWDRLRMMRLRWSMRIISWLRYLGGLSFRRRRAKILSELSPTSTPTTPAASKTKSSLLAWTAPLTAACAWRPPLGKNHFSRRESARIPPLIMAISLSKCWEKRHVSIVRVSSSCSSCSETKLMRLERQNWSRWYSHR